MWGSNSKLAAKILGLLLRSILIKIPGEQFIKFPSDPSNKNSHPIDDCK